MPTKISISPENKEKIIYDYLNNKNLTLKCIANKYFISLSTLCRNLFKWGVRLKLGERERMFSQEQKRKIILEYTSRKKTIKELSIEYGCWAETIRKLLIKNNVKRRYYKREIINKFLTKNKEKIISWYVNENLSGWTIGKKLGVNGQLIYDYLKKCQIDIKNHIHINTQRVMLQNKEQIINLYSVEKYSLLDIKEALEINSPYQTIGIYLKKWGVKIRKTAQFKLNNLERKFSLLLKQNNIIYISQYKIENRWYDFYIPSVNLLIEVQGDYWHGNPKRYKYKDLDKIQKKSKERDRIKKKLANQHGYALIKIWEHDINNDEKKVLKKINKYI